jgi:hypothetical protein
MNLAFNKIKHLLSGKTAAAVVLLLVITGRIIQLIFLFNIRADRSHQMLATHSFVTGHGISKAFALPANLSQTVYEPLFFWPPGYSLLLSPFYALFNHNYIAAGLTLDILCAIALILICRKILSIFSISGYQVNLFTLLTGLTLYSFFLKSSSDAIAITFFLCALYFSLTLLKTTDNSWLQKTLWIGISLVFSASMKFLYMPIILIVPVFLAIKGLADKNIMIKKAGIVSLLIVAIGLTSLFVYQKSISGNPGYIAQTEKGFFSENLLSTYPLIPASFINPETIGETIHQPSHEGTIIFSLYQYLHIFLLLIVVPFGLWMLYKNGFKKNPVITFFFYLLLILALAVTLILSVLSLKFAKEFDIWTYVQEARYYGLITVMIQLSVFISYQYYRLKNNRVIKYLFLFFLLLFLPEMFRGLVFAANRIKNFKKEEYSWQTDLRYQQFAQAIIKQEQKKKLVTDIVLAGSSPYMNNRFCLYSHIPLLKEVDRVNNLSSLNTKTSVLLLVALREDALKDFVPFLSIKEKEDQGQFGGYYFYTLYVEPH